VSIPVFLSLTLLPIFVPHGEVLGIGDWEQEINEIRAIRVEKRGRRALQPNETAKKLHKPGTLEVFDTCYVHLTTLDFRRRWLEKDVSASLTAAAAFAVAGVGMLVGFFWGWAVGREGMRGRCAL
jgi:hypothetical protein